MHYFDIQKNACITRREMFNVFYVLQAKNYQSAIVKLTKQIDEYDVTNGELKEEVETLEVYIVFCITFYCALITRLYCGKGVVITNK